MREYAPLIIFLVLYISRLRWRFTCVLNQRFTFPIMVKVYFQKAMLATENRLMLFHNMTSTRSLKQPAISFTYFYHQ